MLNRMDAPTPRLDDQDDILGAARDFLARGQKAALATVVTTWGSSPRPVGSLLAATEGGAFVGSVSGGCVEGAVISEADAVMKGAPAKLLKFGISNEQAWDVGLACGGKVEILVAPLAKAQAALDKVADAQAKKHGVVLATDIVSGEMTALIDGEAPADAFASSVAEAARAALARDASTTVEIGGRKVFLNVFAPPSRLALVGAVHIAQALAPIAALAGYAVTVIDPRSAFATEARFPGVAIVHDWPDEALAAFAPDRRTAIITLTHDPKLDDPALAAALKSDAFYIGALGSRKTHAARLGRLKEQGFTDRDIARIHGPVGLPIGAVSPAEIAVAILAELTRDRRAPTAAAVAAAS
jgi:xanthine dehydrogenase accessory factor